MLTVAISKSANLQSLRLRKLCLTLIKCPKPFGFEFEGAGYVQAVEGADAEFAAILPRQLCAAFKGVLRHCGLVPLGGALRDSCLLPLS